MAKDPATLWYWNDWHSGTVLMSRFLKGCYMDILHAQFNHGRLSLEEIKTCLGADFGSSWPALQKKFKQDDNGLFFNERSELEKTRRQEFVKSRSNGKQGRKKSHEISHDNHTNNHTEDENENINEFEKFSIERCKEISLADPRWVKANRAIPAELDKFNEYLEKQGIYQINPMDYKRYFAKLKGKYPDLVKKIFSIEEMRQQALELDKIQTA